MKKLIIIEGIVEYVYKKKGKVHSLFYSDSDVWNEDTKNTLAVSVEENDKDLSFFFPAELEQRMTYSKADELAMLLRIVLQKRKVKLATCRNL